jgi:hypothetical protein
MNPNGRRINVTLGPRQQQDLVDLATAHETDQSEVIRRALGLYKRVTELVNEGNSRRLVVAEYDGKVVIELVTY